ncbi:hypothetical protein FRB96_006990 [Tulasnella sp. 330]|nr:hypothetical protein FRB96_006990 [Tulasnella sp. 330]KAG8883801.1 hypothetical protein FRB97_005804 [Tulasnella sp. 331]
MSSNLPTHTRCLVLNKTSSAVKPTLHDTSVKRRPIPTLEENDILVKMVAAAFNHREKDLYPGIEDDSVIGCDGAGLVIASSTISDPLLHKRVFLTPSRGWKANPQRPEKRFTVIGGTAYPPIGTMCEYLVVERDEVIEAPTHLSFEQAAAWPCAGITAYRAVFIKGHVGADQNVLITGIGGGVALTALQLCVAAGANVYVTSSSDEKIQKAIREFGAKGGVNYKHQDWPKQLHALMRVKDKSNPDLDVIIDQAGGDICGKTIRMLKLGAIVVCFGMHAEPAIPFTMPNVMKNIELKGSTMGSQAELVRATDFIAKHKIVPHISHVLDGLDDAERGFELLQDGSSMGKIVVRIAPKEAKL